MKLRNLHPLLTATLALGLIQSACLLAQDSSPAGDELLEKAIVLEDSGKTADAIAAYSELASEHAGEPEIGGRALVRLANLYLREKRRDQAAETLKQVLSQYGNHGKLARHAKEQLTKLSDVLGGAPRVLFVDPTLAATDVPSDLKEVSVTFDRPMMDNSWSFTGSDNFPKTSGKPSYDEFQFTCTLPVELEPGKVYRVGINSASFQNFKSKYGAPAEQSVVLFATAGKDGSPTAIPPALLAELKDAQSANKKQAAKRGSPAEKRESRKLAAQAWQQWGKQQFGPAEELFRKALDRDGSDANTWNGLGWSLFNQGIADEAEIAFKQGIEIDPKQAACLNGLGWIARNRGHNDEAIAWWEKAVEALPEASAAWNGLVVTTMNKKDYEAAMKYLQAWKKVEPNNKEIDQQMEKVKAELAKPVEAGSTTK